MPTYRTKPIDIEAVQWTGNNLDKIEAFGALVRFTPYDNELQVYDYLQDTWVNVNMTDYIIRGNKGEFYPCEAEVFNWKYVLIAP